MDDNVSRISVVASNTSLPYTPTLHYLTSLSHTEPPILHYLPSLDHTDTPPTLNCIPSLTHIYPHSALPTIPRSHRHKSPSHHPIPTHSALPPIPLVAIVSRRMYCTTEDGLFEDYKLLQHSQNTCNAYILLAYEVIHYI